MKGWMQTFIVHNRDPGRLIAEMGLGPTLAFEMLVLGMIVAPLLHSGLVIGLAVQTLRGQALFDGSGWAGVYGGIMLLGYASTFAMTIAGLARSQPAWTCCCSNCCCPLYWLLMAVATLRALRELALRPFHWFKSPHAPNIAASDSRQSLSQASKIGERFPSPLE